MKTIPTILSLGLFVASISSPVLAQDLPDPTGVWTGKLSCKGLMEGEKFKLKTDATLQLSHAQLENQLGATLAGVAVCALAAGDWRWRRGQFGQRL